ncbi:MAG: HIT family protein [Candidatus Aminicenantia bacterium]
MFRYIFAPWRITYIRELLNQKKGCIFCEALEKEDSESLILYRGKKNFIIMNLFPYTPGHLMIAPYRHLSSFEEADKEESEEMMELAKISIIALKKYFSPDGFNLGMNIGKSAGAGEIGHYHLHIVPRWEGDSNFMAVFSKTKVVSQEVGNVYDNLLPFFKSFKFEEK